MLKIWSTLQKVWLTQWLSEERLIVWHTSWGPEVNTSSSRHLLAPASDAGMFPLLCGLKPIKERKRSHPGHTRTVYLNHHWRGPPHFGPEPKYKQLWGERSRVLNFLMFFRVYPSPTQQLRWMLWSPVLEQVSVSLGYLLYLNRSGQEVSQLLMLFSPAAFSRRAILVQSHVIVSPSVRMLVECRCVRVVPVLLELLTEYTLSCQLLLQGSRKETKTLFQSSVYGQLK